jgi:hypothetical protein
VNLELHILLAESGEIGGYVVRRGVLYDVKFEGTRVSSKLIRKLAEARGTAPAKRSLNIVSDGIIERNRHVRLNLVEDSCG